jgi:hypothetical protein
MGVSRPTSHVTLVLRDSHGQQDSVDVHGPGGTIRVAVGRPGHRSSVWRIWANQNKSDVFVAARVLAGTQKFSLHESGDWRNQWVTKEKAQRFTSQENRVLDQWPRPPAGLGGWTTGLTIWVPSVEVLDIADDKQPLAGVGWIPEPPPDSAIGIHVVVAEPDRGFVTLRAAAPMDGFRLADGRVVLVVVSVHRLADIDRLWLDQQRVRARAAAGSVAGEAAPGRRMALFGNDSEGNRLVWDLSWR